MFSLLKKIMSMLQQFGMSFKDLLNVIQLLMSFPQPPDIADEEGLRKWMCEVVHTLRTLAKKTSTTLDDKILKMFDSGIESDTIWPMIYSLIRIVLQRDSIMVKSASGSYEETVSATANELRVAKDILSAIDQGVKTEDGLVEGTNEYGFIDPGTIVTIVVSLLELWKFLRRRRDAVAPTETETSEENDEAEA